MKKRHYHRQFTVDLGLYHQPKDAFTHFKFGSKSSYANAVKILVCMMRNEKGFNVHDLSTTTIEELAKNLAKNLSVMF